MAEAAAKSMLGQISQGHLECPICCCRFTEPKILDCLHSFCLNCLDELISRQQPKIEQITCPVCRRETAVPDTGLHSLSNCFFLSFLVDEVKKQEQLLGEASVEHQTCEECDEGLEAISRCLDCDGNICLKCVEAHQKMKSTKKHRIVKKAHNDEVSRADFRKNEAPRCDKHTNHELCFYCDTCETLTCAKCAALDHRTAEHEYREVADATQSYRQDVEEVLQKFEKSREQFKAAEFSIEHARNRLRIMVTRACRDITAKEKEEIAKIRNKSRLLRDKVTQIGEERERKFEEVHSSNRNKMDEAEQIVSTVNDLMQQADDFELLDLKPKVMHNLEFQKELKFERAQHGLSFIGFKCHDVVDIDLGEVLKEEKWQLKCEFGKKGSGDGEFNFARGVACFSSGDIVVTDTGKSRLIVFTSTGQYKCTVGQIEEDVTLEAPWDVAVTCDDLLLVTDKQNIKVFDCNLKFIRQFTPSQDDADGKSESNLTGVNVDKNNQVAVADKGRKVISVHNLDGSLITTMQNDMVEHDLAISNKERLIFTNYEGSKLLCTNFTGNEVIDVKFPSYFGPWKPSCVCCDDSGDIYVFVRNSVGPRVYHFDLQGVNVGIVAQGLKKPLGLAFTPCGDLVVVDMHSVKIFQRV